MDLKINHLASLSFFRTFDSSLAARHWSNIHKTFKRHLSTFLQDMQNLIKAPISSQGEISSSCLLFRSSTEQAQHTYSNAPKRPVERNTLLLSDLFEKKGRREKNQISYINKFGTESTCPTFGLIEKKNILSRPSRKFHHLDNIKFSINNIALLKQEFVSCFSFNSVSSSNPHKLYARTNKFIF